MDENTNTVNRNQKRYKQTIREMEIVLAKLEIVLTITAMRGNSCGDYGNTKDK